MPGDVAAISYLLSSVTRRTARIWWWGEYLGEDVFWLTLLEGRPVGALLASIDVRPVAWVRLAALADTIDGQSWLGSCLPQLKRTLRARGARQLLWMGAQGLAGSAIQPLGFQQTGRVIGLLKEDRELPPVDVPGVMVRPARFRDIKELTQVDRAAFTPPWWLGRETLTRMQQYSACFLLAEQECRCLGYAEAHIMEQRAHIGRLAVDPRAQGRGVGGLLLGQSLRCLWRAGARLVTLNTQEDNLASQRLYLRFGFQYFDETSNVWTLHL
jgi:ribosomal-protein-alanine N-acetyltransferase